MVGTIPGRPPTVVSLAIPASPRANDRFVDEPLPRRQLPTRVQHRQARGGAGAAGAAVDAAGGDDHSVAAHRARARERHRELGERHVGDVRILRVAGDELPGGGGRDPVAEGDQVPRLLRLNREAERRRVDDREEGATVGHVDRDRAQALHLDDGAEMRDEARDLVALGNRITAAAAGQLVARHPENPDIHDVTFSKFAMPFTGPGTVSRNAVIGTGTSARLAVLHARGQLAPGQGFVHESIIGSRFEAGIASETTVGGRAGIVPTIAGQAWITGVFQHGFDPSDPFRSGYTLPDLWFA